MTRLLGQVLFGGSRLGDGSWNGLRPRQAVLPLSYTITYAQHSAAIPLSYHIQRQAYSSLLLYYLITPPSEFAINGDGTIIAPDQVNFIPRTVAGHVLSAAPLLQGYAQMTWTYSKIQLAEFNQIISYYDPRNPVVRVTYPDEMGTWVQRSLVMQPPSYGTQTTMILSNVVLTFTRMF